MSTMHNVLKNIRFYVICSWICLKAAVLNPFSAVIILSYLILHPFWWLVCFLVACWLFLLQCVVVYMCCWVSWEIAGSFSIQVSNCPGMFQLVFSCYRSHSYDSVLSLLIYETKLLFVYDIQILMYSFFIFSYLAQLLAKDDSKSK